MKKSLYYFVLLIPVLICSSCLNIIEELWLNQNGSGVFHYKIESTSDVGAMLLNQIPEREIFSRQLGDAFKDNIDTILSQKDFFEKLPKESFSHPHLIDQNFIRIFSKDSYLSITFITNFSHIDELNMGMSNLRGLLMDLHSSPFPDEGSSKFSHFFSLENDTLKRIQVEDHSKGALKSQEQKIAAELFFSNTFHKMIFHLPKKPSDHNFKNCEIKENQIIVNKSLIDILTSKDVISGFVKF